MGLSARSEGALVDMARAGRPVVTWRSVTGELLMDTELDIPDGNRPASEKSSIWRLAAWFLRQVGLQSDDLEGFTNRLLAAFCPGLPVNHPAGALWFATLDAIDSDDN